MKLDVLGRTIPEIPREVRAERARRGWQSANRTHEKYWSKSEEALLIKTYRKIDTKLIMERLNKTDRAIYRKCGKLGLMKKRRAA